ALTGSYSTNSAVAPVQDAEDRRASPGQDVETGSPFVCPPSYFHHLRLAVARAVRWVPASVKRLPGNSAGDFRILPSVSFDGRKQKQCKVASYKNAIDFLGRRATCDTSSLAKCFAKDDRVASRHRCRRRPR